MKKRLPVIGAICLLIFAFVVLFLLHPVTLIGSDTTRETILFGLSTKLEGVMEMSGGYRCYVNDSEYFWLPSEECEQTVGESPLAIHWRLGKAPLLMRGEP